MRKALNDNPVVQLITIGVIGVVLAFMLFSTVLKGEEAPATDPAAAEDPAAAGAATATETPVAPAPATPTPADAAPEATAPPAGGAELKAGDGLPKEVVTAYAADRTIALLVIDPDGISDAQVKTWTETLSGREGVSVFVVDVKDIADYSRVTSGVGLSQTPALMVVTPRNLSDGMPTASVSYGFRSQQSIEQALADAAYKAGPVTSYP